MPAQKTSFADVVFADPPSGGFREVAAAFEVQPAPADAIRFEESVALMRYFNLIEGTAGREQVIALARKLASSS